MTYLLLDIAPILLIALPMTLVIITGEIDLSVASVVGPEQRAARRARDHGGLPIPVAAAGRPRRRPGLRARSTASSSPYVGLPSLAVTIGTLALFRGLAVGLLGTKAVTDFPQRWTRPRQAADRRHRRPADRGPVPRPRRSPSRCCCTSPPFGRGVYEIGLNNEAAHFTGVDVRAHQVHRSSCSPAWSRRSPGVYFTLRFGSARGDNATGLELQVIAAVLLGGVSIFGGRGALHGVIAGVLLIGVISSALRLQGVTVNVINIIIGAAARRLGDVHQRPGLGLRPAARRHDRGRDQTGPQLDASRRRKSERR